MKLIIINLLMFLSFSKLYSTRFQQNWIQYEHNDKTTNNKKRIVWSKDLHNLYLEAKNSLEETQQTPANILEKMKNINPKLSENIIREQVSSHLQKDRNKAKKDTKNLNKMNINYLLN